MSDLMEVAYLATLERIPGLTREHFSMMADGYELHPVMNNEELVGAILRSGTDIHAAILSKAHKRWYLKFARDLLADTIKRHGKATTSVMESATAGHEFVKRLGFVEVDRRNGAVMYEKKGDHHGR